jgi:hypothetical protein
MSESDSISLPINGNSVSKSGCKHPVFKVTGDGKKRVPTGQGISFPYGLGQIARPGPHRPDTQIVAE